MEKVQIGSRAWNDEMFKKHPTPYKGIAGIIEEDRVNKIIKIIARRIKNNTSPCILEVGCEAGNLLKRLMNKIPDGKYIGTDISENALREAEKKLGDKARLLESDVTSNFNCIENLPELDFIICSEVLEHIPDTDKAILGLYRLTNPNTTIIITVPIEKIKNLIKITLKTFGLFKLFFSGIEENKSEWHIQDFSKEDILRYLSKYFIIEEHSTHLLLHRFIVARKKMSTHNKETNVPGGS